MFKKFFTLKNSSIGVVIVILMIGIVWSQLDIRKVEQSAIVIAQVTQLRAGLSAYMAERGAYPEGQRITFTGSGVEGSGAALLCVGASPASLEGFLKEGEMCDGTTIFRFSDIVLQMPFVYHSNGKTYSIAFFLPRAFGAFRGSGVYCAKETGIVRGKCA